MAAISQQIPNLLGGVSQQPDPLKLQGQVKEAVNVFLDPTFGCKKRPPTKFIANLADDVPADAKWFPILRDENERYVAAVYKNSSNTMVVRVWAADTGVERTVTMEGSAAEYLTCIKNSSLKELTVNDYTFLCNAEKEVSMSTNTPEVGEEEALVVINQVAYNTTYSVDFLKDGTLLVQEKVYKARKLTVSPGSFEDTTGGSCGLASSQSYNETSGSKTGLGFTLTTNCTPTLVSEEVDGDTYPTALSWTLVHNHPTIDYPGTQAWGTYHFGSANDYAKGSYLYRTFTQNTSAGSITVRVEVRVEEDYRDSQHNMYSSPDTSITGYTVSGDAWTEGMTVVDQVVLPNEITTANGSIKEAGKIAGLEFTVSSVQRGRSSTSNSYKSVYNSRVTLNNGGQNWRQGDSVTVTMAGKDYVVTVVEEDFGYTYASESQVTYTTPLDASAGTLNVGSITSGLTTAINALSPYTATPVGNVIHISRTDSRVFNIQTRGGTTNNALYGIKNSVNDISRLPDQCFPDVVLKVKNTAESDADDYYVKFIPSSGDIPGQGAWEETVKPGITTDINSSTMPHALIREADGTFIVRPLTQTYSDELYWAGREVGDEDTNPAPSFVGKTITDMVFFMNRLGFLSSDSVVLSQPGDFFNFFAGSAIAVSDADPIDMAASATKPSVLKTALGTAKGLVLFAENSQFLLAAQDTAFGPSTVKMTEISNYAYTSNIKPVETGVSLLFSTEADTFSKVFEMAIDSVENRPLVSENTRIIPEYIPPDLTLSASSANNSFVVFGDDTDTLYTFKFFNVGNERSLAGWSKWQLPCPVKLLTFTHDTAFVVLRNGTKSILSRLEILDDPDISPISAYGSKFVPRLDNYIYDSDLTKTVGATLTEIRFPDGAYVVANELADQLAANFISTTQGSATNFIRPEVKSDANGYYIEIANDLAALPFVLGLEYEMRVDLPSFYVKEDKRPDRKNTAIVETVYLDLYLSGRYEITLNRLGYDSRVIDLDVTTSDIYFANTPAVTDVVTSAIPVFCQGDHVDISIKSSDPLPASMTSYSWEGHYSTRGIKLIP